MLKALNNECNTSSQHPFCTNTKKPTKHTEGYHLSDNNLFSILTGNEKKLLDFYRSVAYKVERYNAKFMINEIAEAVGMNRTTVMRLNKRLENMGYIAIKRSWRDFNRCAINAYTVIAPSAKKTPAKLSTASRILRPLCKVISAEENLIPTITSTTIVNNDPIVADQKIDKKEVVKKLEFAYDPKVETPLEADLSNLIPMYDDPKPKDDHKTLFKCAGNAVELVIARNDRTSFIDKPKTAKLLYQLMKRKGSDPVNNALIRLDDRCDDSWTWYKNAEQIVAFIARMVKRE